MGCAQPRADISQRLRRISQTKLNLHANLSTSLLWNQATPPVQRTRNGNRSRQRGMKSRLLVKTVFEYKPVLRTAFPRDASSCHTTRHYDSHSQAHRNSASCRSSTRSSSRATAAYSAPLTNAPSPFHRQRNRVSDFQRNGGSLRQRVQAHKPGVRGHTGQICAVVVAKGL